jgi:hypothetical protein
MKDCIKKYNKEKITIKFIPEEEERLKLFITNNIINFGRLIIDDP